MNSLHLCSSYSYKYCLYVPKIALLNGFCFFLKKNKVLLIYNNANVQNNKIKNLICIESSSFFICGGLRVGAPVSAIRNEIGTFVVMFALFDENLPFLFLVR